MGFSTDAIRQAQSTTASLMKRSVLALSLALLVGLFFYFDLQQLLTLDSVRERLAGIEAWRASSPLTAACLFFMGYIVVVALSLPGATIMTLLAGALFGLVTGTIIVSFASSIGALLAFLVARYLLRDTVQTKFDGERLQTINEGIARDGAFYLFTLRLIPLFPFFLINLLMGLTTIRATTFYGVSQIGMLAGTIVYVNAGTELAQLEHLSGILSPSLLLAFAMLGLLPWLARRVVAIMQQRRIYARWQKPARFDRNLIVIGAGAGGLVSAYIAAAVKAKVTLIEAGKMGGDCLNGGCVPSKALIRSAKLAHQIRHADRFGLTNSEPAFSFKQVMARVHAVISQVAPHDSIERYTALGVEVLQGYARIMDPWTVTVTHDNGEVQRLTTRSIVIATGARPFVPPLPGIDAVGYLTSDTLWDALAKLDQPPKRLVVLGGGPIGCELAQCMARLGSGVTMIEMAPRIMIREDEEVSALAARALIADGVRLFTNHKALRCEISEGRKYIVIAQSGEEKRIEFDQLLCAVGRTARLEGYGLEELGIETGRTISTNAYLETLYPHIYAAGDVAGPWQFTHTAAHQAWYATVNALFGHLKRFKVDDRVIPWSTFIDPEVARVGLNEQEAKEKGIACEVTRYDLADLDRAITDGAACGFVKILTVPGKDRILGVTIVGEHAGELLAEFVLAMKHNLGLNRILATIHTYPTWSEAGKYAAGEWKRAHAPQKLLRWLARYHAWRRG
nr:bifunctional TVP38/TMEM64 family protein/FAD-dependent oxidoreductase [Mariprofundus erugo]